MTYKRSIEWPKHEPYPFLWKRVYEKRLLPGIVPDYKETVINIRQQYLELGMGFEPGDETEIMVDWILKNHFPRTFIFSEQLSIELAQTTITKIPNELIRLPFPSIYLDYSDTQFDFTRDDGKVMTLRGLLFREEIRDDGTRHLIAVHFFHVPANQGFGGHPYPVAFGCSYSPLPDGETQEPITEKDLDECRLESRAREEDFIKSGLFTNREHSREFLHSKAHANLLRCLMINGILYINSANNDVREEWFAKGLHQKWKQAKGKRRTKLKQELNRKGKVFRAGYYLSIPAMPTPLPDGTSSRKVSVRFQCRGHWRHYWIGPRRGERKRIIKWIRPHWKGPELADRVSEKIFKVNTKEKKPK